MSVAQTGRKPTILLTLPFGGTETLFTKIIFIVKNSNFLKSKMESITMKSFFLRFVICTFFCGLTKLFYPKIVVRIFIHFFITIMAFSPSNHCQSTKTLKWY